MSECPDKVCRDNVTRLVFFMKVVGATVGLICTIILATGLYVLAADARDKANINKLDKQVQVYSVKQDTIIFNQELFRGELIRIKEDHDEQMQGIHKQMKEDKKEIINEIRKN